MTRSSPVMARICASTAWRKASRLMSQEVATSAISITPKNAATGVPRRFIPWAFVNDISWFRLRAYQVDVARSRLKITEQARQSRADHPNLSGFLDAFKASPQGRGHHTPVIDALRRFRLIIP